MNMPNFASCHHAILCARVAASLLGAGDFCAPIAPAWCTDAAIAPATPRFFRNDRLETAEVFMCFLVSPLCSKPENGRSCLRGKVYAEKIYQSVKAEENF